MNIPDATATSILLTALLIVWELVKKKWSLFQPRVDLNPVINPLKSVLDALEPIAKNAELSAYAHTVRNGGGRPLDMRNPEWEKRVLDLLTDIRDALLRKGTI